LHDERDTAEWEESNVEFEFYRETSRTEFTYPASLR